MKVDINNFNHSKISKEEYQLKPVTDFEKA